MPEFKFKIILDNGRVDIHSIYASNKLDAFAKVKAYINSTYANSDLIKYEFTNNKENNIMEKNNIENVVNFDFQGWPEYKHTIKDLIIAFGGVYNEETKKWEIPDAGYLNACPELLEDDGMGYGVNEQYIIDVNIDKIGQTCTIWRDKEMPYAPIYVAIGANPGAIFKDGDIEYVVKDIIKNDNGELQVECSIWDFEKFENAGKTKEKYIPERKLFSLEYVKEHINNK